jgi:hypothetical protein
MTITYFLTGSYNGLDNDFELTIETPEDTAENKAELNGTCAVVLIDTFSENKVIWQATQPSFLLCLKDLDEFIIEKNIMFYSKILTSAPRYNTVDKELEGFILNRLEY